MFSNVERQEMSRKKIAEIFQTKIAKLGDFFLVWVDGVGHEHWTLLNMTF